MLFGKIDYLNLLPFHVFLKKYPLPSYVKKGIEFKKDVPSVLCKKLYNRCVDAAVISSVESRRKKYKKILDLPSKWIKENPWKYSRIFYFIKLDSPLVFS